MLGRVRLFALTGFLFLFVALPSTFGQLGGFCPAGTLPNGYIDLSALPPAPVVAFNSMSSPITATLPVQGIPGLTVQVQIPSLAGQGGPIYTTNGGTITFSYPSIPPNASPNLLTLTFSTQIQGVGFLSNLTGRFPFNLSLTASDTVQGSGSVVTYNGQADFPDTPYSVPLQTRAVNLPFDTATVTFSGGQYSGISFSNFRVQSVSAPDLSAEVPTTGLLQWLRADAGAATDLWQDQSGNGNNATQTVVANQPVLLPFGNHCQPTFFFSGNSFFNFSLPIAGLTDMTVFVVASANNTPAGGNTGSNAAVFWKQSAAGGSTYVGPFQTEADFRFGTTQAGNFPSHPRARTAGQDFTITRAVHNGSTDILYVNGLEVLKQGGKLATLAGETGAGYIGQGASASPFNGEISEILVYNRAVKGQEAERIEHYLRNKYGLR